MSADKNFSTADNNGPQLPTEEQRHWVIIRKTHI